MKIFTNEYGKQIDYKNVESTEQRLCEKWCQEDDVVLELGARYGTVSCLVNDILNDEGKELHYVVEPDSKVWSCLINNMEMNNCDFHIIKGIIGKKKYSLEGDGYAMTSVEDDKSTIESFDLPDVPFNTLILDCEGYMESFYNENKELFSSTLKKIIFECDYPEKCDYNFLLKELGSLGFIIAEHLVEYGLHFYVLTKNPNLKVDKFETHYTNKSTLY